MKVNDVVDARRSSDLDGHRWRRCRLDPSGRADGNFGACRRGRLLHLSLRHFELGDDDGFVAAINSGETSANQLFGAKRREHDELKRSDSCWLLHYSDPPDMTSTLGNGGDWTAIRTLTGRLW